MKKTEVTPSLPQEPLITDKQLRKAFFFSLLLMLGIIWISGFNVGYHQDEMDMNTYGKANYAYYMSGLKDTTFMGSTQVNAPLDHLLKYYGCAFEYMAVGINKVFHLENKPQEFNTRHALNQLFAITAILFAGLIARKIAGWRAALFTAWLLFLTPTFFGAGLFNTKDMPFCTGYIASLYFIICFLEELPEVSWKTTIYLMLSFAFTTNTRIGGIMLLFYLFLFMGIHLVVKKGLLALCLKNIKGLILKLTTIVAGGMTLVVLTWPFLLRNPGKNIMETIDVIKKFPLKVKINFEGIVMDSLTVPPYYLPKFMSLTIPLFILAAAIGGVISYALQWKKYHLLTGLLVVVASIFPIWYAIHSNVAVYTGWRHFLFTYPGVCIIASVGLSTIIYSLKKTALQAAFLIVCVAAMAKPIMWSIKNHPYEYVYFNELGGGFSKAFYEYETDYWAITVRKNVEWLMHNEPILQSKDTVTIATNTQIFVDYYIHTHYPAAKVKVVRSGYMERNTIYWQYGVFHPVFLEPNYLEGAYPPTNIAHAETIDGIPLAVVVKDTARLDLKGIDALINYGNFTRADSFFTVYLKDNDIKNLSNIGLYAYVALMKAYQMKTDESMQYTEKTRDFFQTKELLYYTFCALAIDHANKGEFEASIKYCNKAIDLKLDSTLVNNILAQVNKFIALKQVPVRTL